MLNSTAPLWPQTSANNGDAHAAPDPWGVGAAIETQARLWNQFLDANRNFWTLYAPWMSAGPWLWGTALAPQERDEAGVEPAETVDGIPDPLESQARSWNRFLDAQRGFWGAMTWPVPGAPWVAAMADAAGAAAEDEAADQQPARRSRPSARKSKGSRSKAA